MPRAASLLTTAASSFLQALQELRTNKLRTFLSLLGISIGIFCIISVLTVLDSMESSIRDSMENLGSDVLYVNRKPWMPEEGEYKWWEYLQRPPMSLQEMRQIEREVPGVRYAAIADRISATVKFRDNELEGVSAYGVSAHFDKLQNIDISEGRYLSDAELNGGSQVAVIGHDVATELFGATEPLGKLIYLKGKGFQVVGVIKKSGQNMAGFDFDNCVIFSFAVASAMKDMRSLDWNNDPMVMIKAKPGVNLEQLKDEVVGQLRALRRIRPGGKNDFSINQLSQVSERLTAVFGVVDVIGAIIGGFSLLVGAFGIANIMFVTVKERTKVIGLKKAIGARRSVILSEFLIEAIILCLIGGLIGIFIVFLLSLLLTYGLDFEVMLTFRNFFVGLFISALVGVVAGIIPARRAARMDPVVAIRSV